MKKCILTILVAWTTIIANAQSGTNIATGTWRYHLSYNKIVKIHAFNNLIYASSDFALFSINPANNEMTRLLKVDGFYQDKVSSVSSNEQYLIFGYDDGTLFTLTKNNQQRTINGFKNSVTNGSKTIKDIHFINTNECLISTDAGILKMNCKNGEIVDNFTNIGNNGKVMPVIGTYLKNDTLFALGQNEIKYALFNNSSNLSDYQSWKTYLNIAKLNKIVAFDNKLYVGGDSNLYIANINGLKPLLANGTEILDLSVNNDRLDITRLNEFGYMNTNNVYTNYGLNLVQTAIYNISNDEIWYGNGLGAGVLKRKNNLETVYEPAGPKGFNVFNMSKGGPVLYSTGGGVTNTFGNAFSVAGFNYFHQGKWFHGTAPSIIDSFYDYTYAYFNPKNNNYYLLNQSYGLIEMNNLAPTRFFNSKNSTLGPFLNSTQIHTSGFTIDSNQIIWVCNHGASSPLHAFDGQTWKAFNLPSNEVTQICTDKNNNKWIINFKQGIIIYSDNNTSFNENDDKYVRIVASNSKLLSNEVNIITVDKNNWVWIGTVNGLNVVTNNLDPFDNLNIEQLVVSDIDGKPAYLLGENRINDILVDGGNRKWIATESNGVFLISADGQQQILNFNTSNSPLSSNRILSIGQTQNGEIFFGTDKGTFSYQSDASAASNSFTGIKVYPNPVPPNYNGLITIDGLAYNSTIKITDANGMLVTELKSNGGKASWNGLRTNGSTINSGVYYIFGINEDSTETAMGKFIYIK